MANVLVILSGCGVFDGSEIHESVVTLLHLHRADATVTIAAPEPRSDARGQSSDRQANP